MQSGSPCEEAGLPSPDLQPSVPARAHPVAGSPTGDFCGACWSQGICVGTEVSLWTGPAPLQSGHETWSGTVKVKLAAHEDKWPPIPSSPAILWQGCFSPVVPQVAPGTKLASHHMTSKLGGEGVLWEGVLLATSVVFVGPKVRQSWLAGVAPL